MLVESHGVVKLVEREQRRVRALRRGILPAPIANNVRSIAAADALSSVSPKSTASYPSSAHVVVENLAPGFPPCARIVGVAPAAIERLHLFHAVRSLEIHHVRAHILVRLASPHRLREAVVYIRREAAVRPR